MRVRDVQARTVRRAFTLLEILLATSIGVLLLAALYAAVDVQFRHAQAARSVVEQSTLARALLARIGNDIACSAGPADPSRFRATGSQASSSQQTNGQQTNGQQTNGQSTSGQQTNGQNTSGQQPMTGQPTTSQDPSQTGAAAQPATDGGNFQFTLVGSSDRLSVFVTRVVRPNSGLATDLRRISYWLVAGSPGGLAWEEIRPVTADEASIAPPDMPDGVTSKIIAEEVRSLSFSYWDGSAWQTEWDGTTVGSDGQTPIGPPLAVAVTIGLPAPGSAPNAIEPTLKYHRHVISLMTANGASQQTLGEEMP